MPTFVLVQESITMLSILGSRYIGARQMLRIGTVRVGSIRCHLKNSTTTHHTQIYFKNFTSQVLQKKTNRNIIVLDIRVQSFTYFFDDDKSFKTEDSNRICFIMEPFFEIIALTWASNVDFINAQNRDLPSMKYQVNDWFYYSPATIYRCTRPAKCNLDTSQLAASSSSIAD